MASITIPVARMTRAAAGGRPDGSGGGAGGSPRNGGASLAVIDVRYLFRSASSSADGPSAPVTSAVISSMSASTMCSGSLMRPFDAARRPAASAARRMIPDAQMSLKTPRSSRIRYISRASASSSSNSSRCSSGTFARDVGDLFFDVRGLAGDLVDGRPDRTEERCRQLERVGIRDVEAVDEPIADEVEIGGHRGARRRCPATAAPRAPSAGSPSDSSSFRAALVLRDRVLISRWSSVETPAETGAEPRIRPSRSVGGRSVQSPDVCEEVADGDHRRARVAHVLVDHLGVVVVAALQIARPAPRRRANPDRPPAARGACGSTPA